MVLLNMQHPVLLCCCRNSLGACNRILCGRGISSSEEEEETVGSRAQPGHLK